MGTNWWALLGDDIHRAARRAEKKNYVNRCNECGKLFAKTIKWPQTCPKCGSSEHETVSKEVVAYEATKKVKATRKAKKETSWICKNCRNTLKPTAKFCGSCGTRVA